MGFYGCFIENHLDEQSLEPANRDGVSETEERRGKLMICAPQQHTPQADRGASVQVDEDTGDEQPQNRRKSAKSKRPQASDDESEDDTQGGRSRDRNANLEKRLAHKLVRYAIACEYSRTPVRREAVRDKGAHPHGCKREAKADC